MEMITSIHNERVKKARSLREGRERKKRGLLLIEGSRFILEAVDAGAQCSECFYSEEAHSAEDRRLLTYLEQIGVELVPVSHQVLSTLADTLTPQGVVAVAQTPNQAGPDVLTSVDLVLIADEIRDPGNLGAILRTVAAVGAGLILMAGSVDLTNPKVIRSSAGACYAVPIWWAATQVEVTTALKQRDYRTYVLDMHGSGSIYQVDLQGRVALVVGNEAHGPSPVWEHQGAQCIHIPMPGRVESLNAGVASAVVLYEALRQRL
jgi:TrmH family RNA methyltransferase